MPGRPIHFAALEAGWSTNHTAGGERPTGLEAPKAIRRQGVTAPSFRRPPPAGPKAGNRPEAGWYGCEAPQGSPARSPRRRKARQSRSGASLSDLSPV